MSCIHDVAYFEEAREKAQASRTLSAICDGGNTISHIFLVRKIVTVTDSQSRRGARGPGPRWFHLPGDGVHLEAQGLECLGSKDRFVYIAQ